MGEAAGLSGPRRGGLGLVLVVMVAGVVVVGAAGVGVDGGVSVEVDGEASVAEASVAVAGGVAMGGQGDAGAGTLMILFLEARAAAGVVLDNAARVGGAVMGPGGVRSPGETAGNRVVEHRIWDWRCKECGVLGCSRPGGMEALVGQGKERT